MLGEFRFGELKGVDQFGNKYYENLDSYFRESESVHPFPIFSWNYDQSAIDLSSMLLERNGMVAKSRLSGMFGCIAKRMSPLSRLVVLWFRLIFWAFCVQNPISDPIYRSPHIFNPTGTQSIYRPPGHAFNPQSQSPLALAFTKKHESWMPNVTALNPVTGRPVVPKQLAF